MSTPVITDRLLDPNGDPYTEIDGWFRLVADVTRIMPGTITTGGGHSVVGQVALAVDATGNVYLESGTTRTVTDGVTATNTTVTSNTAAFTSSDVGSVIFGTGIPTNTTITVRNSATSVTISQAATATATGVTLTISTGAQLYPNVTGSSASTDVITVPTGTVYEYSYKTPGQKRVWQYISVTDDPGPLKASNLITDPPASLPSAATTTAIAVMTAAIAAKLNTPAGTNSETLVPVNIAGALTFGRQVATNNGVIIVGDSTSASNDYGSSPLVVNQSPRSGPVQGVFGSNRKFELVFNAAVGGRTTTSMLSNFATEVTAKKPGIVHIMGGLNDMGGANDAGTIATQVALALSNIQAMVRAAQAIPAIPIVGICWGKPLCSTKMTDLGKQLRQWCRQTGVRFIDYMERFADPTTTTGQLRQADSYYNGATYDFTHLNITAAQAAGQLFIDATADIQVRPRHLFANLDGDIRSVLTGGTFGTTGSGVPSPWVGTGSLTGVTHTVVAADADDGIQGNWWHINGTNATGNQLYYQQVLVSSGLIAPGDLLAESLRVVALGFTADSASLTYTVGCSFDGGNFSLNLIDTETEDVDWWPSIANLRIPSTNVPTYARFFIQINNASASNFDLWIGQWGAFNLTKLGDTLTLEV